MAGSDVSRQQGNIVKAVEKRLRWERKCTIVNCKKSGYLSKKSQGNEQILVHGFPKDPIECQQWVSSFPNKIKKVTQYNYKGVCSRHWPAGIFHISPASFLKPWREIAISLRSPKWNPSKQHGHRKRKILEADQLSQQSAELNLFD
ncbi:hypothetical protein PoB_007424500 [Plakobranchus ocellatus]|uniref:THAP-type domain-containing protein n=1 Tax=Plakobranchus ocellatus TaxID=259542 RepID=A0AAV4DUB2_9GAST|nr:hypothetical protein PoB_007424500 [Plakobranchus ocellatus]